MITNKGFTILELIVSIAIFAFMTALLLAKYGNFNQGVLLTNLAYDVALSIRNAQSYGLNVKSSSRTADNFGGKFGVHFSTTDNTKFIFFIDNGDGVYGTLGDADISTSNIQRGSKISSLGSGGVSTLDITFKRPDPNAIIKGNGGSPLNSAEITLEAIDGSTRKVLVNSTGQISVQ